MANKKSPSPGQNPGSGGVSQRLGPLPSAFSLAGLRDFAAVGFLVISATVSVIMGRPGLMGNRVLPESSPGAPAEMAGHPEQAGLTRRCAAGPASIHRSGRPTRRFRRNLDTALSKSSPYHEPRT